MCYLLHSILRDLIFLAIFGARGIQIMKLLIKQFSTACCYTLALGLNIPVSNLFLANEGQGYVHMKPRTIIVPYLKVSFAS
jgi:hypothetical protein